MHSLQHWLYLNVLGNLVASMLWSIPLWTVGYFKLKKQHARHHQQLKDHIDYQISKLKDN
jgi:hypothetical protein